MRKAILTGAWMDGARLSGADLCDAHFGDAHLNDAYLYDIILSDDADLTGTHLFRAVLPDGQRHLTPHDPRPPAVRQPWFAQLFGRPAQPPPGCCRCHYPTRGN